MKKTIYILLMLLTFIFTGCINSVIDNSIGLTSNELFDYIDNTVNNKTFPAEEYEICITDADNSTMKVKYDNDMLFMTEFSAKDKIIAFAEMVQLYGNFTINVFEADGIVVYQKLYYNTGDVYVFWENGGFEEFHSEYNNETMFSDETSISFYKDENGSLKYCRRAVKFEVISQFVDFSIINDRDDFFEEYGSVSIGSNGKLVFTSEKIVTIYEYLEVIFGIYFNDGYPFDGHTFYSLDGIFDYKVKMD